MENMEVQKRINSTAGIFTEWLRFIIQHHSGSIFDPSIVAYSIISPEKKKSAK